MKQRIVNMGALAAGMGLAGWAGIIVLTASAQTSNGPDWAHPVTEWGEPDLQGMWPIGHLAGHVPLQRPERFADRAYLTDEEYEAAERQVAQRSQAYEREIEGDRIGMGHWAESMATAQAQRQTSLIVDPQNGQLPEMTEEGRRKQQTLGSSWHRNVWDDVTDFDTWDRCITRGLPASMFPFQYNNGIQIVQSPGYVVINLEMIHEARIIPTDGRSQLPESMRNWLGESRGHWEGNTLVIETTHFNGISAMTNVGTSGSPRPDIPSSEELRLVERLTRVGENTIQYEITVADPVILTRPWTATFTWERDPDYTFFEYACHEGNETIRDYIETSRYERQQRATSTRAN
jgi:hypothetical protein